MNYFEDKQKRINQFVTRANLLLPNNPLCYPGHFITGQVLNPDILFVSINPGHSNKEDWDDIETRRAQARSKAFAALPCKYVDDVAKGSRYAKRIVDIVCGGDITRLAHCAETSFVSYFAAPKEAVLQAQLAELPEKMQQEHHVLTQLDLQQIRPKHIVCMGWRCFDRFLQHYGENREITVKKLPLLGKMEDYYALTEVAGVKVHGLRHLCTKLTVDMKANLEKVFVQVWEDIDKG